jgi:hypothetical protein
MPIIGPALHRVLDFVTVLAFMVAPSILGLSGFPATLAYTLAGVHLGMTLLTQFSPHDHRLVPLSLHGVVEALVGVTLLLLPWVLHWSGTPRIFFIAAGAVILVVWGLSRYAGAHSPTV